MEYFILSTIFRTASENTKSGLWLNYYMSDTIFYCLGNRVWRVSDHLYAFSYPALNDSLEKFDSALTVSTYFCAKSFSLNSVKRKEREQQLSSVNGVVFQRNHTKTGLSSSTDWMSQSEVTALESLTTQLSQIDQTTQQQLTTTEPPKKKLQLDSKVDRYKLKEVWSVRKSVEESMITIMPRRQSHQRKQWQNYCWRQGSVLGNTFIAFILTFVWRWLKLKTYPRNAISGTSEKAALWKCEDRLASRTRPRAGLMKFWIWCGKWY